MRSEKIKEEVYKGSKDEYLPDWLMGELAENLNFEVIERSAMEKDSIKQTSFHNISLPHSSERYDDDELISRVKDSMKNECRDVQKYQVRQDDKSVPSKVQIWRHKHGYSAFLLS